MLDTEQKREIAALIENRLNEAEEIWNQVGDKMLKKAMVMDEGLKARADSEPSRIPGHRVVTDRQPKVDQFIALVADMRDSSKHLQQAIGKPATVSMLERVFYETSALLPALAQTIQFEEGSVTEYLGDGVLSLFQVDPNEREQCIRAAYRAARNCVDDTRGILNAALGKRYNLPPIELGVGLAWSNAVVTLIGLDDDKHPKAFGECVYRATKLSNGRNEIHVDQFAYEFWPTSNGGKLRFTQKKFSDVDGYLVG
jgi:class 3 adenylate cyclase